MARGGNAKCGERGLWSRYPYEPRGKVNRIRGKTRHFPRGWKWRVRRERPVEPVPLRAAGESEPYSRKSPALSPEVEMASAARGVCGAGAHASRGGKVNRFRRKVRHFPGRERLQVRRERPVEPVPQPAAGESEPFSQEFPALSPRWKCQVPRERSVKPVPLSAPGESEPFSPKFPALSPGVEMPSAAREACEAGAPVSHGGK